MNEQHHRFVFDSSLVLDHTGSPITAIAIEGQRLYIGLEDGTLEGYNLQKTSTGVTASLSVRKPISKKTPIMSIQPLPQTGPILILSADGILHVAEADNFQTIQLPFRHVVSVASNLPPTGQPRIAVAIRVSKRAAKCLCCDLHTLATTKGAVKPIWEVVIPDAPEIWDMSWVGDSIVIASSNKYLFVGPDVHRAGGAGVWRELLELPIITEGEKPFVATQPLPWNTHALLAVGEAGVIIGPSGDPIGDTLRFDSIPPVRALAAGGNCALAICEDGAHVFDPSIGSEVQFLGFGLGIKPLPGQRIHAASSPYIPSSQIHGSLGNGIGGIAVAGKHMVWVFSVVPPADQGRELLARRDFTTALDLASSPSGQGWRESAYAQAALLFMQDCRFEEAVGVLDKCAPFSFQPVELLPLFPGVKEGLVPSVVPEEVVYREHWGLHPRLESVEGIAERWMRRRKQMMDESDSPGENNLDNNNKNKEGNYWRGGVEKVSREAASSIVQYLFRARELQGVAFLAAVDTFIFHLLLDLQAADQGTAFAAVPNKAILSLLETRLTTAQWNMALATLQANAGETTSALDLYKRIAQGEIPASPVTTTTTTTTHTQRLSPEEDGHIIIQQQRCDAAEAAADLLSSTSSQCTEDEALAALPWLLEASQTAALKLIRSRSLPPSAVLPLLDQGTDARWRYLEWLVNEGGCVDKALHTELALALAQSALKDPSFITSSSSSSGTYETRMTQEERTRMTAAYKQQRRQRLYKLLETSTLWDPASLLDVLQGTELTRELILVYKAAGDHAAALRTLAVVLHDIPAAEEYALNNLPPSDHGLLLHIVLHPEDGTEPHWEDACHVVATLGAHLDPLALVNQLPPEMPLSAAHRLVAPVVRDRIHRKRQASVMSNLNAARLNSVRVERVEVEGAARVVVDDTRACLGCHLRLGGKVFVVVPPGHNNNNTSHKKSSDSSSLIQGSVGGGNSSAVATENGSEARVYCFNCWKKAHSSA